VTGLVAHDITKLKSVAMWGYTLLQRDSKLGCHFLSIVRSRALVCGRPDFTENAVRLWVLLNLQGMQSYGGHINSGLFIHLFSFIYVR